VLVLVALVIVLVVGVSAPGPAGAAGRQGDPVVTAPASVPAGDGSGPYLTGRTEPSMTQRIVDSLIWVWVLAVLVLAPVLWFWSGRRSRARAGPVSGPPPPN
jgi:hypothetical protein